MKTMHVHVNTENDQFDSTIKFYTTLFGQNPTKTREHYAKWQLDDPKVNFVVEVIDVEGDKPGIHHVGIQVEEATELHGIRDSLKIAQAPLLEVGRTTCCFSESEKNWTMDPTGLRWETFQSFGDVDEYGEKTIEELANYTKSGG